MIDFALASKHPMILQNHRDVLNSNCFLKWLCVCIYHLTKCVLYYRVDPLGNFEQSLQRKKGANSIFKVKISYFLCLFQVGFMQFINLLKYQLLINMIKCSRNRQFLAILVSVRYILANVFLFLSFNHLFYNLFLCSSQYFVC